MFLAQLNTARLKHATDHPKVAELIRVLDRIDAIADRMPGFVWRLVGDGSDPLIHFDDDDPLVFVNLTVWRDVQPFETFVWKTVHKAIYLRRAEWFEPMDGPNFVMWWQPEGVLPTLAEGGERLRMLAERGPSPDAFGWEDLPGATEWKRFRGATNERT